MREAAVVSFWSAPTRRRFFIFPPDTLEAILREVRNVLRRPEVRRRLPGINDRVVNAFLTRLEAKSILITNVPDLRPLLFDSMGRRGGDLIVDVDASDGTIKQVLRGQ